MQGCGWGPDARLCWHSLFLLLPALLDNPLSSSADVQASSLVQEWVSRNRGPQGESLSWFCF